MSSREFDLLQSPLSGTHLIDASAGTGKTYTISALVVRLLLESKLPLAEILVVTFTEAAAEDLKRRIRQKVRQAIQAFVSGNSEDLFLARLVAGTDDRQESLRLLTLALSCFDEAAVFTIHGFCQRVLAEYSLESGVLFDSELVTDLRDLLREIGEDFFRLNLYEATPLTSAFLLKRFTPATLLQKLGNIHAREDIRIVPEDRSNEWRAELPGAEAEYHEAFRAAAVAWPGERERVTAILLESPALNRNRYRPESVSNWLAALSALLAGPLPPPVLFEQFDRFTPDVLAAATKKGQILEESPFFSLCARLAEAQVRLRKCLSGLALSLEVAWIPYARTELARRKARLRVHSFDDLLTFLHRALAGERGQRLAGSLRSQYRAAMIDEFQDTDPVQYEIFTSIFAVPERLLCLIVDPKQAIYSFRGADIFAYIRAVRDIDNRFTLRENYRSRPDLIRAVNAVFGLSREPFVFKEISFEEAKPAAREDEPLLIDRIEARPFRLWVAKRLEEGQTANISKEEGRRMILSWLQEEIRRLLDLGRKGRARRGDRNLSPGDLAVLVRTNREARMVQEGLAAVGVASVLNSSESLFASREAVEVHLILLALAERNNRRRIRAALATRLFEVDAERLDLFAEEDESLGAWFDRFGEYHQLWVRQGFVVMFSYLLLREGVRERLLTRPGGERSLTNVLHLQEVLHRAAGERRLGVTGLGHYLGEKIAGAEENPAEELQLRLASDSALVQIVTIHKSKGLQYPVVFCPFCWEGSRLLLQEGRSGKEHRPGYQFHEEERPFQPVLDLGSDRVDENRILALREEAAENLRLLYVALTRASHVCYLAWGPFSGAGTSPLAYLLHGWDREPEPTWGIDLLLGRSDHDLEGELEELVKRADGGIDLTFRRFADEVPPLPSEPNRFRVTSRHFVGEVRADWRIESFSSLHRGGGPDIRAMGTDIRVREEPRTDEAGYFAEIMNFPAGPGPGTFLHELLEKLDFRESRPEERNALIRERLAASGYDLRWEKGLAVMLKDLLNTGLTPDDNGLILATIERRERLNELEFYFPLESVDQVSLRRLLADLGLSLEPGVLRGMMKGYIYLVFRYGQHYFIVDWKSNHLGWDLAAYAENRLPTVMAREGYNLQYLIYTVALHRYLGSRLPGYSYEEHFGGVFYIFLRGVRQTAGPAFGIFRDKPDVGLIRSLTGCFAGDSGSAAS